ncbi:MAG: response regulator [Deltaproteobacteria bacterium]|nr:response regulator [Deltaproteobacteria bacterium]
MSDGAGEGGAASRRTSDPNSPVKSTILLVDDVPENLRVLAEVLVSAGHSTRAVTSAKAALKLLETVKVDLVLVDINMPEMSGFELCSVLKRMPSTRDVPVLFLSAATDTEHKVEAFRRGGVDYVSKPFQFEEIRARVETHLRLRRLQLEQKALLERTLAGAIKTLKE